MNIFNFNRHRPENTAPKAETSPEVFSMIREKMGEVAATARAAGKEVTEQDIDMATLAVATEAVKQGAPYTAERVQAIDVAKMAEKLEMRLEVRPHDLGTLVVDTNTDQVVRRVDSPEQAQQVIEEERQAAGK